MSPGDIKATVGRTAVMIRISEGVDVPDIVRCHPALGICQRSKRRRLETEDPPAGGGVFAGDVLIPIEGRVKAL
jgi:hypothetical protein